MLIDRAIYPITTLGPGRRVVLWTVGCSKHCEHCASPELWQRDESREISPQALADMLLQATEGAPVDGLTITGGDPLEQAEQLVELLRLLKPRWPDILVYTGYTVPQLKAAIPAPTLRALEQLISVLVDGPYIEALNDGRCALRGSANQRIIFYDESERPKYLAYLSGGRRIQNVFYGDAMISVGIHNREGAT